MTMTSLIQICSFIKDATIQWIDDQKVPYATKNSEWVGFDNKDSYVTKVGQPVKLLFIAQNVFFMSEECNRFFLKQVRYLQEQKFGGAFVWALDLDDFAGKFCGEGAHPLLGHLNKLLNIGKSKYCITIGRPKLWQRS